MPFDIETAKKFFFDRDHVANAVDRGKRKALAKLGAFIRRRARSSIRKRRAISQPGKPPSSHEGSLRKLILFAYDAPRDSVVVGPTTFKKGEAPALLEYGGTATRPGKDGQPVQAVYRPRPYMRPAFEAELPKAPQMFKDAIH
jgi:hypothetical protein